jgi:hypothetical protein
MMPPLQSRFSSSFSEGPLLVAESQVYRQAGWHTWDPSITRDEKGLYHLFYGRWPEAEGFDAWVTHSEIARATGTSLSGPFTYAGPVLQREPEGNSWDGSCFHNGTVKRFGDKYYLYYMGNRGNGEWWDHRNHQRIGVAVADAPEGPWQRFDQPVLDVSPGAWDGLMVSNPTVTDTADGRFLMIYKGVAEGPLPFGGRVLHGAAWADAPTGPFEKYPEPLFNESGVKFGFEDPCIWREGAGYFCIIKDMGGHVSLTGESSLVLMQSPDGIHWEKGEPCPVQGKKLKWIDGATRSYERIERPSIFWDAASGGLSLLAAVKTESELDLSFTLRLIYPQPK